MYPVSPPERKSDTWLMQLSRDSSTSVLQLLVECPTPEPELNMRAYVIGRYELGWEITHAVPVKRAEGLEWLDRRNRYV